MSIVVVTGASGNVGRVACRGLAALGWNIRGYDVRPPEPGPAAPDTAGDVDHVTGDVRDAGALEAAMSGVDAVLHLAAIPTEAPWPEIREANIDGTFQVFDAARRAGVPRVVFASSIHANGFARTDAAPIGAESAPRPDTLYGVSKVFGEALGRMYADRYGMQVACVRIGAFTDRPGTPHHVANWLSPGDAVRLFHACLTADNLGYSVVYGESANSRGVVSLETAQALGYQPADDSERFGLVEPTGMDPHLGEDMTGPDFDYDRFRS